MVDYWLARTEHLVHEDYVPYRVVLIGEFGTDDLTLKRDILRFMVSEDPYGTLEFVECGIRNAARCATTSTWRLIVSMVDWMSGGLQDALVTEERDPGLFHRWRHQPERQKIRDRAVRDPAARARSGPARCARRPWRSRSPPPEVAFGGSHWVIARWDPRRPTA